MKKSQAEVKALGLNTLASIFPVAFEAEKARLSKFSGKAVFNVAGHLHQRYKNPEKSHISGQLADGTHYSGYLSVRPNAANTMVIIGLDNFCINGGSSSDNNYFCIYVGFSTVGFALVDGKLAVNDSDTSMPKTFDLVAIKAAAKEVEKEVEAFNAVLSTVPYEFRDVMHLPYLKY